MLFWHKGAFSHKNRRQKGAFSYNFSSQRGAFSYENQCKKGAFSVKSLSERYMLKKVLAKLVTRHKAI